MSKGLKEALTVLIVTHWMLKGSKITVLIVTQLLMLKGSKGALAVLSYSFERVLHCTQYRTFNAMSKGSKDYVMLKKRTYTFFHNFLNI